MKDVYIIGGGPSGMMAAISCKLHHLDTKVTILERNTSLGVKLKLSGGGRCNVCANISSEEVVKRSIKNGRFLYSALQQFNTQDIIQFFESAGCPLVEEDHQRMFPQSNKASSIMHVLLKKIDELGIRVRYQSFIESINVENQTIQLHDSTVHFDHIILATGGKSYHQSGSDGSGYALATAFGHTITDLFPAEVPLVSNDACIQSKVLQGISCQEVELKVYKKGKVYFKTKQDVIFTHFGLSGPVALQASTAVRNLLQVENAVPVTIDFLPDVSKDSILQKMKLTPIRSVLQSYKLPKRLIDYMIQLDGEQGVIDHVKNFCLQIHDTRGFQVAFVTNGGIPIQEIEPRTMLSKRNDHLSVCGEILDVHGFTGGLNMTIAFVSGYVAGKNCI